MRPIYNKKHNYIMFYNAKAACCVMRKTYVNFHFNEFTDDEKKQLNERQFHDIGCIHGCNNLELQTFYNCKMFVVVRNPYERAISAYYDKFLHLRSKCTWRTNKLKNLYKLYKHYKDINILKENVKKDYLHKQNLQFDLFLKELKIDICNNEISDSFKEYLEFLVLCKDHKIDAYDEHHNTQSFLPRKYCIKTILNKIDVVHIENFEEELEKAVLKVFDKKNTEKYMNIFKENASDKNTKNSTHTKIYRPIDGYNQSREFFLKHIKDNNTVLNSKSMINNDVEELIYKLYKEDFINFNYQRLKTNYL